MIIRPEKDIEYYEILSVIVIPFLYFPGVVPPVYIGGDENIVQKPPVHIYVAMGEQAHERGNRTEVYKHIPRHTHYKEQWYAEQEAAESIHEMEPPCVEEPEFLDAVVYGVETPHEIPGMSQAVLPV